MLYVLKRRIHLNESSVKFNKTYCLKSNEKTYFLVVNTDNQTSDETVYYTFTINASNEHNNSTPVVVTINGEATNSITAMEGTEITYRVDCTGYQSNYGTLTLTEDTVLNIVLIGNS